MFEGIYDALHREMSKLDEKYAAGTQMSDKDLVDIDRIAHALKCIATYEAMNGGSASRDRGRMTGRYYADQESYRRY